MRSTRPARSQYSASTPRNHSDINVNVWDSNSSLDSSYFKDVSNFLGQGNDSSFLIHVDDDNTKPRPKPDSNSKSEVSENPVDWDVDVVDSAANEKIDKFDSLIRFSLLPNKIDVSQGQFVSLPPDELQKLLENDEEAHLRLNNSAGESFASPNYNEGSSSLRPAEGIDDTIGAYFFQKSSFPEGNEDEQSFRKEPFSKTTLCELANVLRSNPNLSISNVNKCDPSIWEKMSTFSEEVGSRQLPKDTGSTRIQRTQDEDLRPSTSIGRFSSFLISSRSDGLDKEDIIKHVLKYCKKQDMEEPVERHRDAADNLEDSFSRSLEPDMSGLVGTSRYTLNHSTPIKRMAKNLDQFSLKSMCSTRTGTSLDKDIMTRLSQLPHEITNSISESVKGRSESTQRSNFTVPKQSVSMNTSNRSSTCSTSSSTQTQTMQVQVQPQPPFPMYGYPPIIVQVQCPYHQAPLALGQCNNNQQGCMNTHTNTTPFNPWMQMPMIQMPYPQYAQIPIQSNIQNCGNCQCTSKAPMPPCINENKDQTLAIESKNSDEETEEIEFSLPRRGLPRIHIDKPIIRWGPTDLHLGEYTSVTIVNQSDSALFLRCGVVSSPESKHFKIVSETYERKVQGISLDCEIPVGGIKTISLVFTPEKEKRYLGELQIKCKYLNHSEHDGIYTCKLPLVGTGVKSLRN